MQSILRKVNKTTCVLDPFPIKVLMYHVSSIIDIILRFVNLCFLCDVFPALRESAIIFLNKKQGLVPAILKNYRPVVNLSCIEKIIERATVTQTYSHLINYEIVDNLQADNKVGQSCELSLLVQ